MNGLNKLECYITLGWKSFPGTNGLVNWAYSYVQSPFAWKSLACIAMKIYPLSYMPNCPHCTELTNSENPNLAYCLFPSDNLLPFPLTYFESPHWGHQKQALPVRSYPWCLLPGSASSRKGWSFAVRLAPASSIPPPSALLGAFLFPLLASSLSSLT